MSARSTTQFKHIPSAADSATNQHVGDETACSCNQVAGDNGPHICLRVGQVSVALRTAHKNGLQKCVSVSTDDVCNDHSAQELGSSTKGGVFPVVYLLTRAYGFFCPQAKCNFSPNWDRRTRPVGAWEIMKPSKNRCVLCNCVIRHMAGQWRSHDSLSRGETVSQSLGVDCSLDRLGLDQPGTPPVACQCA